MSRLPNPGGDAGNWGTILNDYLTQAHNDDGTLKPITAPVIADSAITTSSVADAAITEDKLDPDLAAKVNAVSTVTMNGDVTGQSDNSLVAKLNGVAISGTPTAGQVLKATSATAAAWASAGDGTISLAGDVTGTAAATVVSKIQGVAISGTPTAGQVLKATSATAATWGTDEVGGGGGGTTRTVVSRGANYTAVAGDFVLATAAITVTLPASPTDGDIVSVKKMGSGTGVVTVVASGSATIDGGANWTTTQQYIAQEFICDGTDWFLM